MAKHRKKLASPKPYTPEEASEVLKVLHKAIDNFHGELDDLERAMGMYLLGKQTGWRVLVIIHTKRTIRKYEKILGIEIRKAFEEVGPLATRSVGYSIVVKLSNFWKAVSGDVPVAERKRFIGHDDGEAVAK